MGAVFFGCCGRQMSTVSLSGGQYCRTGIRLIIGIQEGLTEEHRRFGRQQPHILLRQKGLVVDQKRPNARIAPQREEGLPVA